MKKKVLAALLASTMVVGMMAGCGDEKAPADDGADKQQEGQPSDEGNDDQNQADVEEPSGGSDSPLVIANDAMSEKFSPFFAASVPDQNVVDVTQIGLVYNDRAGQFIYDGMDGYTSEWNGTEYTYYTPANIEVTENEDGTVFYDFTLRDDLKFADGEEVTADDVIFSFYVYCDPAYDGSASTFSLPIEGMEAYRSGMSTLCTLIGAAGEDNTDFSKWTEEEQTAFWAGVREKGIPFVQEIVDYLVAKEYIEDPSDIKSAAAGWGFELADGATLEDFFMAIGEQYGWDFAQMANEAAEGGTPLEDVLGDFYTTYTRGIETGDSAPNITGIQKTGDKTVRIVLTEVDATAISQLGISIAPLHYYGDESKYDYENNQFGFERGDLSGVKSKTTEPMGAGPYKFASYENKTLYLEANENYYKGAPKIKSVQFKETGEGDKLPGVLQGTVDISEPSISKDVVAQIEGENGNGELSGDVVETQLVDYRGYGYIGMCSINVKVGDDPASEQSKNLRKAIATVIAVYRDVAIDSYYGEAAAVINYPISNTSWAAPQKSDADYKVAFSTDVEGNPIYTEGMSEDDKYAAALQASLGYFEAAGYTVTDGKITAAPEGAEMSYEVMIPADGKGDHPSFGILTSASEALKSIGFDLVVNDLSDNSILWDALDAYTAEMWCAAWNTTIDPDMFQIYHTNGGTPHYRVDSPELDELIMEGKANTDQEVRKAIYKEALEFVVDYAVEIPVYQRQEATVVSSQRVNIDTLVKDPTSFYSYLNEIETLEMK